MSDPILGHGALPSVHPIEERFSLQAEDLAKFLSNGGYDFRIGPCERCLVASPPDEASQQRTIFGSAMRKFIVDEGAGQHALAFAPWDKEPEAGRKSSAHFLIVSEIYGNRRSVGDALEFGGQFAAGDFQKGCGCVRRDGENDGIEMI